MDGAAIAAIVQLGLQIVLELINAKKASGQPLVIEEIAAQAGQIFDKIQALKDKVKS